MLNWLLSASEEQLSALRANLEEDAGLIENLKGAAGLDAAVVMANEDGFVVTKSEYLAYQAN
jgi:hypothetical protein